MAFNITSVINRDSDLWNMLWGWPKIELHRHLEGSIRLTTLIEVAREFDIPLPAYNVDQLRPFVQVTDENDASMASFLSKFDVLRKFYCSMDIIARIAREAVEDAARDNVKYMELRFTPHALARQNNYSYEDVIARVCEAVHQGERDFGTRVRLIVSVNRHESLEIAERALDAALATQRCEIVAMDLAGQESGYSARPFRPLFQRAKAAGLFITVHAGEWEGPHNVREAIEELGADRIGHGVRSVEDSRVVQLVRERDVTLEVCPTSNLQTAVVRRFWQHPLPDLLALNLRVTINTDDPSVSDTTLTDEYMTAMLAMGVTLDQIKHTILTGVAGSFQPPGERKKMAQWFRKELGLV